MKEPKNIKKKVNKFLTMKKPSKETLEKIKEIIDYCSNVYYDSDIESPLLDEEFDKLVNHYSKFAELSRSVNTTSVKRNKNLIDTQHLFPELVGTLDKTNYLTNEDKIKDKNEDANTVEEWLDNLFSNYEIPLKKTFKVFMSWKIDGNSITISYDDNKEVIMALTRGKNGLGSDKTNYFKNRSLPDWFPIDKGDKVGIKYEAVTTFDNKVKIEEIMGRTYASPCSLTSGILGSNDATDDILQYISLVPIRIQYKNKKITREEELKLIEMLHEKSDEYPIAISPKFTKNKMDLRKGLPIFNIDIKETNRKGLAKVIADQYEFYIENRENLPYPVDGLVFEFVDTDMRELLGRDTDRNKWEFALKFPYDTKRSTVEDIEFYVSTSGTGRITPVVKFKPIKFSRAVCDHVSIANYKRFKELKLAKGDEVIISYRNDVLSYLTIDENMVHVDKPIKFIGKCPICHQKLKLNENKTFVNCINPECPAIKIGKYNNYLIKIGVDSVRENTLTDLYNAGLLKDLSSLYYIKESDIERIDGYQSQSAKNIITSIHSKMEVYDYELLGALGFTGISTSKCKEICKKYSLSELERIAEDDFDEMSMHLIEVDGVEIKTATHFEKDFNANLDVIKKLEKVLTVKELKNMVKLTSDPKSLVFTGFRDPAIQHKLEVAGHSVKSSVTKKTNMLIMKEKGTGTVKEKRAKELGVEIYDLEEFTRDILPKLLNE